MTGRPVASAAAASASAVSRWIDVERADASARRRRRRRGSCGWGRGSCRALDRWRRRPRPRARAWSGERLARERHEHGRRRPGGRPACEPGARFRAGWGRRVSSRRGRARPPRRERRRSPRPPHRRPRSRCRAAREAVGHGCRPRHPPGSITTSPSAPRETTTSRAPSSSSARGAVDRVARVRWLRRAPRGWASARRRLPVRRRRGPVRWCRRSRARRRRRARRRAAPRSSGSNPGGRLPQIATARAVAAELAAVVVDERRRLGRGERRAVLVQDGGLAVRLVDDRDAAPRGAARPGSRR